MGAEGIDHGAAIKKLRSSLTSEKDATIRGLRDNLLKAEYDQAWNHLRHMETSRAQHLGFLFAALITFAPILKAIFELQALGTYRLVAVITLGAAYAALSIFVWFVVRRSDVVLRHYESVMHSVRQLVYGPHYEPLGVVLDVRRSPHVIGRSFRISRATEGICTAVTCAVLAGIAVVALAAVIAFGFRWATSIALAEAVLIEIISIRCLWRARGR